MEQAIDTGQEILTRERQEHQRTTTHRTTTRSTGDASSSPDTISKTERNPALTTSTSPKMSGHQPLEVHDCPVCKDFEWLRRDLPVHHPDFGKLIPCECQSDDLANRRLAELQRMSGMTESELTRTLDDVRNVGEDTAAMKQAAREFLQNPCGFFTLWGGVGNGKTLILQAMVNDLRNSRGKEGAYIPLKDLIDYVRAGFDEEAEHKERARYDYLRQVPVLAVDEFDKVRMTPYADEFRTAFLDYRYRLAADGTAFTLFAMNCPPDRMPPHIYDRLRDGRFQIVSNQDDSMRPAMERG